MTILIDIPDNEYRHIIESAEPRMFAKMLQDAVSNGIVIPEARCKGLTNSQVLRAIFSDMSWYEVMGEGHMSYVTKVNKLKGTQWERKALTYDIEWGNMPYRKDK